MTNLKYYLKLIWCAVPEKIGSFVVSSLLTYKLRHAPLETITLEQACRNEFRIGAASQG